MNAGTLFITELMKEKYDDITYGGSHREMLEPFLTQNKNNIIFFYKKHEM